MFTPGNWSPFESPPPHYPSDIHVPLRSNGELQQGPKFGNGAHFMEITRSMHLFAIIIAVIWVGSSVFKCIIFFCTVLWWLLHIHIREVELNFVDWHYFTGHAVRQRLCVSSLEFISTPVISFWGFSPKSSSQDLKLGSWCFMTLPPQ